MIQRPVAWSVVALVLLTFAVHFPALHGGFIWDDDDHLTQNFAMTAPDGLRQIWSSLRVSRYYPLTLTTFWVERRAWGLEPMPYHAVNILLHAASAVLIFFILRRLNVSAAWLAAAFWAIHPTNVESVAWITELKNAQSGLFFFVALLCYLQFDRQSKPGWYAAALACFAAALASKPSTVTFPAVLLGLVWWQRSRITWADVVRTVPFFLLSAGMSLLTIAEQKRHILGDAQEWSLTFAQRIVVTGKDLWFYLGKLLWPHPIVFVYPRWDLSVAGWWPWVPAILAAGLAAVLWLYRDTKAGRAGLFGLGYFLLALLPVLGFFDVYYFRYSFVSDHFQYLASLGPLALVATAIVVALRQPVARAVVNGAVLLALGSLSWRHAHTFQSNETLWRDTLAKNPRATIALNNLGTILHAQGQDALALAHYRQALALAPDSAETRNNLGNVLNAGRQYEEAIAYLREALRLKPDYPQVHNNLGAALAALGRYDEAAGHFREAVRLKPDFVEAHVNLAGVLARQGKLPEAIEQDRAALAISPDSAEIHCGLALKLVATGASDEAATHLQKAILLQPAYPDAYQELGRLLIRRRQYAEALRVYHRALDVIPRHLHLADELAWLLATCPDPQLRRPAAALEIADRIVTQTKRQVAEPLDTLAVAQAAAGRFDDALGTAGEALILAQQRGATNLTAAIQGRIGLYQRQQSYDQPDTFH